MSDALARDGRLRAVDDAQLGGISPAETSIPLAGAQAIDDLEALFALPYLSAPDPEALFEEARQRTRRRRRRLALLAGLLVAAGAGCFGVAHYAFGQSVTGGEAIAATAAARSARRPRSCSRTRSCSTRLRRAA